jgi:hypothetical protein
MSAKFRIVQKSKNGLACAIYLASPGLDLDRDGVGDLDELFAAALPGFGIVATVSSGLNDTPSDLEKAWRATKAERLDTLAGFSGGCQGVRNHLLRGLDVRCVVLADGAHSEWPTLNPLHIGLWRELGHKARAGERVLVATSTAQRYTQRIPKPFAAVSTVLAEALGIPELGTYKPERAPLAAYPGGAVVELHSGGLHVYGFPGTDCDRDAHIAQLTKVLPELLARHAAPDTSDKALGGLFGNLLEAAKRVNSKLLESVAAKLRDGLDLSHGARAAVSELVADAVKLKRYHRKGSGYLPKLGDLVISARAGGNPERGGQGHVEIVSDVGESITTIGGNEANRWVEAIFEPGADFLGYIETDKLVGSLVVDIAREQIVEGVAEVPGPAANARIQAYHARTRRGGSELAGMPGHESEGRPTLGEGASDEIPWCASGASWCVYEAISRRLGQ